jgi:hypothetical protein
MHNMHGMKQEKLHGIKGCAEISGGTHIGRKATSPSTSIGTHAAKGKGSSGASNDSTTCDGKNQWCTSSENPQAAKTPEPHAGGNMQRHSHNGRGSAMRHPIERHWEEAVMGTANQEDQTLDTT